MASSLHGSFHDFEEEDNNPFAGTNHLFASGIGGISSGLNNSKGTTGVSEILPDLTSSAAIFGDDPTLASINNHGGETDSLVGFQRSNSLHYSINEAPHSQDINDENNAKANHNGYSSEGLEESNSAGSDPIADDGEQSSEVEEDDNEEERQANSYIYTSQSYTNINSNAGIYGSYDTISIVTAGQTRDTKGSKAIAYTIRYNYTEVKRRYSEFDSFRKSLIRLFPTLIIPPIPEKHSVVKYFLNPLNAKNDVNIIEKRKRMLSQFLNRCLSSPQIRTSIVWQKFLDPTVNWNDVLVSPPISIIPSSNLLAPPLAPAHPSPLHVLLPIPQSTTINNFHPREEDKETYSRFKEYEQLFKTYRNITASLEKNVKKQKRHLKGFSKDLGELGAYYNAFSLEDNYNLSSGIEKTGQAIDSSSLNSEALAFRILTALEEPVDEINQNSIETLNVLKFRKLKEVQLYIIDTTIKRRKHRVEVLKHAQEQSKRLEEVLRRNAEQSPTIAAAVKRLEEGHPVNKVSPWSKIFGAGANSNNSNSTHNRDVSTMSEVERNLEIEKIEKEIERLTDCLEVILKDIEQVNESINNSIQHLLLFYNSRWKQIVKNFTEGLLIWLHENLKSWEEAKQEIDKIKVVNPESI